MYRYEFATGDTGKPLKLTLTDENGPVDITGATVTFYYTINGQRYSIAVPVTDGPNGIAQVQWSSGDFTNWITGQWPCDITAVIGGTARYFPPDGTYGTLTIRDPL